MLINGAQLHMLFNHLPVIGFLWLLPLLAWALLTHTQAVKNLALVASVVVGLSSLPALFSGEPAEDIAERIAGVSSAQIHAHEEMAEIAAVLGVLTAGAAAAAWMMLRIKPEVQRPALVVVALLALMSAALLGKTAHEGGLIRHSELNNTAALGTQGAEDAEDD